MPRYSYTCDHCAEPFQVRLSYAELDDAQPECPTCGGTDCQRGLSKVNLQTGSPIIRITVRGSKDEVTVDGILDTGFDGFICLPIAVAVPLGLELIDVADAELADGAIVQDELVFAGKVLWGCEFMDVDILLTKSTDTLIGTAMLKNSDVRLIIL